VKAIIDTSLRKRVLRDDVRRVFWVTAGRRGGPRA
jgi:hypothetical protein